MKAFLALAAGLVIGGCGGGGGTPDSSPADGNVPDAPPQADGRPDADFTPPVLRHPLPSIDDLTVAQNALRRLGAPVLGADNRCNNCHAMTNAHLHQWNDYSAPAYPCLNAVTDVYNIPQTQAALQCLRDLSDTGILEARALGAWASAGRLDWFKQVFNTAYEQASSPEYNDFLQHVAMPPSIANTLDQDEFDYVAEWMVRGMPLLDDLVPAVGPGDCTPSIDPEVATRVANLAAVGWRSINESNLLSMYGCGGAATTLDCMSNQPVPSDRVYATGWEVAPGTMKILSEMPGYSSSFWTRSSADGRFVAQGGGDGSGGSTIIDLTDDSHIGITAAYDPGFFPDNTGFVFQGFGRQVCAQSILLGHPSSINTNTNPACNDVGIGLYQHLGRMNGGDYFAIYGNFVSDNGGFGDDPSAFFTGSDNASLLPMIFDGTTYQAHTAANINLSFEGDAVISPSTKMMVTRRGDAGGNHIAFVLHAINATPNGSSYDITSPEIGTYCASGGKPAFSYDERWLVYHHVINGNSDADAMDLGYTDHLDPGFAQYRSQGTSNIYLLDLLNGARSRITHMAPGQFAYFPHFRSDGWIYFLERDGSRETIVGSDYALRVE